MKVNISNNLNIKKHINSFLSSGAVSLKSHPSLVVVLKTLLDFSLIKLSSTMDHISNNRMVRRPKYLTATVRDNHNKIIGFTLVYQTLLFVYIDPEYKEKGLLSLIYLDLKEKYKLPITLTIVGDSQDITKY